MSGTVCLRLKEEMEDTAFDDFLQTPIMGQRRRKTEEEEDLEQGTTGTAVRVNVASHQAVTRGNGAASTTSSRDASYGGGRSQQLQPQVVWGWCLLQGLADHEMEDLHAAELRTINDQEVSETNLFKRPCFRIWIPF